MSNARKNVQKLNGIVYASTFGVKADGVTNDSAALQAALDYVKANGLRLKVQAGTIICKNIRLEGGALPWALEGAGKDQTIFQHLDGNGTLFFGAASSVGYELADFTLDCRFLQTAHAGANHGLSITDTSGVRLYRVRARNYKNSGLLLFASVSNTFGDCIGVECEVIGNGLTTNNGMLFAEMPRCKWIDCVAKNCGGSPGIGIQIKNDARFCSIVNGYADTCNVGLGFGTDTVGKGASNSIVAGFQALSCVSGFNAGEAAQNHVSGLLIDMSSAVENGIDFVSGCVGNTVYATVRNINAGRTAVRLRTGTSDNTLNLGNVDNINTTGKGATFDSGSQRNVVRVERVTNPTSSSNGPAQWVSDSSIARNNAFEMVGTPYQEAATLATDIATLKNPLTQVLVVDTEASAATDNLVTITGPGIDNQRITVRSTNDARTVVVKITGNIGLVGGADMTLNTRRCNLVLLYSTLNSKWQEISRATHA